MAEEFQQLFDRIRGMFATLEAEAVPKCDAPGRYYLDTHEVRARDGYRTAFGGVEIKKNYVSAHIMPVYDHPDLLDDLTDGLKKRMQGKSCFNFKKVDEAQLTELAELIERGRQGSAAKGGSAPNQ